MNQTTRLRAEGGSNPVRRYLLVQPYGRETKEATTLDSFDAIEDAFAALDALAERLHEQGIDVDSFNFRVTDATFRTVGRPRRQVQ